MSWSHHILMDAWTGDQMRFCDDDQPVRLCTVGLEMFQLASGVSDQGESLSESFSWSV